MIQTQQELKSVEARLSAQLVAAETHAKDQEVQLKHEIECITSKLETQRGLLTASEKRLQQQTERVNTLETQLHDQQRAKEDAEALIAHLRHRFDTYRQWIDGTVVPHLRQQRQEAQQQQVVELRRVEHELVEAKKFINRQAQHIACLKSDVHWLNAQNKQVSLLVVAMGREHKEQWVWNKDWYDGRVVLPSVSKPQRKSTTIKRRPIIKKVVEEDDYSSDTISFSSRSSFSNDEQDETSKYL
jgi:chromosome segregation ATPase